ncbi:FGGY family carbohydrate kinase, partial [Erysipelothrix rhusiopathiae]|nr:FGGY family carbohydrate kinase [Erysipelothrix rhusiopathiae]
MISKAQTETTQIYPKQGWVEQDPMEIWATQSGVLNEVLARAGIGP